MILNHYSKSAGLSLRNIRMSPKSPFKPGGLWLSDDSRGFGWAWWCVAEEFRMENLRFRYAVEISMKNILVIDSPEKAVFVSGEYSFWHEEYGFWEMDWKRVTREWAGMLCSPYRKLQDDWGGQNLWWSTIDCDSACVWDRRNILSVGKPELTGIPVKPDWRHDIFREKGES